METVNWQRAIARNRDALLRIVAALFAMTGLTEDVILGRDPGTATLPRHLRCYLLRILRPAESAARRLIVVAARGVEVKLPTASLRRDGEGARKPVGTRPQPPRLSLPLIDPLKRFDIRPRHRRPKGFPRISVIGVTEPRPIPDNWVPSPDDEVSAERLCRRLHALKRALGDLDCQAKRLARWYARRDLGLLRAKRFSPMRPGHPPSRRKRPLHEVDDILRECHSLAHYAMKAPDTS